MKKVIYALSLAGSLFLFSACNEGNHQADDHDHDHTSATASDTELGLNNGAKWTVDTVTNSNYIAMKTMTNMFAVDPFPPLGAYQTFGNDMSNGINKMMDECTMKGADHDALHTWLNPIIRQSNDLKSVSDTARARALFDSVHTRINLYPDYFVPAQ